MLTVNQKAIIAKVDEVLANAKAMYPMCHMIQYETIKWINGTVGGYALYKDGRYYLAFNAEATEKYFDEMLNDTVAHEVAHTIMQCLSKLGQFGYNKVKPHGPEWQRVATRLGASPTRCHTYELSAGRKTRKFNYLLPIAGIVAVGAMHHKKILQGYLITVKKTREVIRPQHLVGEA